MSLTSSTYKSKGIKYYIIDLCKSLFQANINLSFPKASGQKPQNVIVQQNFVTPSLYSQFLILGILKFDQPSILFQVDFLLDFLITEIRRFHSEGILRPYRSVCYNFTQNLEKMEL
jgi:hypothetical protein